MEENISKSIFFLFLRISLIDFKSSPSLALFPLSHLCGSYSSSLTNSFEAFMISKSISSSPLKPNIPWNGSPKILVGSNSDNSFISSC